MLAIVARVDKTAKHSPQRVAIACDHLPPVSYKELSRRSRAIAHSLVGLHIRPGDLVTLFLPRSPALVAAILGVSRAGAAYTIVEAPEGKANDIPRLMHIPSQLIICDRTRIDSFRSAGLACVDFECLTAGGTSTLPSPSNDSTAYVLYTSGSTGLAKGVAVTHSNVTHYTDGVLARLGIRAPMRYAHVSTFSADLGNTQLFLSLYTGGTLYIASSAMRLESLALWDYLVEANIDVLKITPSHWRLILTSNPRLLAKVPSLSYLIFGGERLSPGTVMQAFALGVSRRIFNHYGPTETTIGAALHEVHRAEVDSYVSKGSVPIGKAIGDTRLLIARDDGSYATCNCTGELVIGGPQVASGYINPSRQDAKRFTALPGENGRFYRTGDRVSADVAGELVFEGRIDRQVKINGFRVELESVESALRAIPGISNAVAITVTQNDDCHLVAAVTPPLQQFTISAALDELRKTQPSYMVPSRIFSMDVLPLDGNGKIDYRALEISIARQLAYANPILENITSPAEAAGDLLLLDVCRAWAFHLGPSATDLDADFFSLGGDSVIAIRIIAELQVKGYRVSSKLFLDHPTVNSLVAALRDVPRCTQAHNNQGRSLATTSHLSPAQTWFFLHNFEQYDHWNQILLFRCSTPITTKVLEKALRQIIERHSALRTAYRFANGRWMAHILETISEAVLSLSDAKGHPDIDTLIYMKSREVQARISLANGVTFQAHLFKNCHGNDLLLLVAHHLSVDAISWWVILDELLRIYGAVERHVPVNLPPPSRDFWDWAEQLSQERYGLPKTAGDTQKFLGLSSHERAVCACEGSARTTWVTFSAEDSTRIVDFWCRKHQFHISNVILGALLTSLAKMSLGADSVIVERHGRAAYNATQDISRTVGWFTSTVNISIPADPVDVFNTISTVSEALASHNCPYHTFGTVDAPALNDPPSICFNFIPSFHFGMDSGLKLTPAEYSLAPARGARNWRPFDLVITGKVVKGAVVIDFCFSPERINANDVIAISRSIRLTMLCASGLRLEEPGADDFTEFHSNAGLLVRAPRTVQVGRACSIDRPYRTVLLTGATGFLGVHVPAALADQTDCRIFCLVRERNGLVAQRLASTVRWYFPAQTAARILQNVSTVPGDLADSHFGLPITQYKELSARVDAVYHMAGNVRLFGAEEQLQRDNLLAVRNILDFVGAGKRVDLHYMSTLAVAGIHRGTTPYLFDEDSLDIGQEFQNAYELSKFAAERLIREFAGRRPGIYVYRAGTVSGHSETARFQQNAGDNQFIQLIAAFAAANLIPARSATSVVLSPVDTIAASIVKLSVKRIKDGGTFHVDSDKSVTYTDIFNSLRLLGFKFAEHTSPEFSEVFLNSQHRRRPEMSLGLFWASRRARNICFQNERTLSELSKLGIAFPALDIDWLRRFFLPMIGSALPVPGECAKPGSLEPPKPL